MTCVYMGARNKGCGEEVANTLKSQGLDVEFMWLDMTKRPLFHAAKTLLLPW
jgi:hypothetical protein